MAGLRDIFRKRNGLDAIQGFAGGTLGDQLDEDEVIDPRTRQPNPFAGPSVRQMQPTMIQPVGQQPVETLQQAPEQQPTQATSLREAMTRQRPADDFPQTRTRYADPIQNAAQDYNVIRDKPLSLRDKFGLVAQNLAVNLGGTPLPTRRQRDEARAQGRLGQQVEVQKMQDERERLRNNRPLTREERADELERDNLRQVYQQILASGQDFSADNPEHKALHDRAQELRIPLPYGKKSVTAKAAAARPGFNISPGQRRMEYNPETGKMEVAYEAPMAPGTDNNATVDENIAAIQTQQSKIDAFLGDPKNHYIKKQGRVLGLDANGAEVKEPDTTEVNPEWTHSLDERNRLDAEIRDWRAKRKGGGSQTAAPATTTQNYQGRTMSKANFAKYAQDHKMTLEAAQKELEGQGIQIR